MRIAARPKQCSLPRFYNLCRLGKSGYSAVMNNLAVLGDFITKEILAIDDGKRFELICDNTGGKGLPLVCWRLKDGAAHYDEFAIAHVLRESGWVVPAYTMAPHMAKLKLMRIVIRDDFSRDRARAFLRDLKDALKRLDKTPKAVLDHHAKQREEKKAGKDSEHSHSTHNTAQHNLQRHGKTQVRSCSAARAHRRSKSARLDRYCTARMKHVCRLMWHVQCGGSGQRRRSGRDAGDAQRQTALGLHLRTVSRVAQLRGVR